MDSLGWIIAVLLLLGFGKSGLFVKSAPFDLGNQQPTPEGIPFMSTQDQNNQNTANARPPWGPANGCAGPSFDVGFNNNPVIATTASNLPTLAPPKTTVRFYQ